MKMCGSLVEKHVGTIKTYPWQMASAAMFGVVEPSLTDLQRMAAQRDIDAKLKVKARDGFEVRNVYDEGRRQIEVVELPETGTLRAVCRLCEKKWSECLFL